MRARNASRMTRPRIASTLHLFKIFPSLYCEYVAIDNTEVPVAEEAGEIESEKVQDKARPDSISERATPSARASRHARFLYLSHPHYPLSQHATYRSLLSPTTTSLSPAMAVDSAAGDGAQNAGHFEVEIPVAAEEVMTFSPTPSRSRAPAIAGGFTGGDATETSPLLANKKERKPFYRPRPLWCV